MENAELRNSASTAGNRPGAAKTTRVRVSWMQLSGAGYLWGIAVSGCLGSRPHPLVFFFSNLTAACRPCAADRWLQQHPRLLENRVHSALLKERYWSHFGLGPEKRSSELASSISGVWRLGVFFSVCACVCTRVQCRVPVM